MAASSASMTASHAPCEHKQSTACMLAALPTCCACADKRPMAAAYPIYIDGAGMRNEGRRWHKYCWKCREYHMRQESFNMSPSTYPSQSWAVGRSRDAARPLITPALPRQPVTRNAHPGSHRMHSSPRDETVSDAPINNHTHPQSRQQAGGSADSNNHIASASYAQSAAATDQPHGHASEMPAPATSTAQQRQTVFPLGTREEVEREDYQSPLTGMFMRAWDRYRTAEEVRRAEQALNPQALQFAPGSAHHTVQTGASNPSGSPSQRRGFHQQFYTRTLNALNRRGARRGDATADLSHNNTAVQSSMSATALRGNLLDSQYANPFNWTAESLNQHTGADIDEESFDGQGPNAIDLQDRPPALSSAEMLMDISCRICKEQRIDTLTLPCSHFVMCHWCAAAWAEEARRTRRDNPQTTYQHRCPMCRQQIKETKRVHLC